MNEIDRSLICSASKPERWCVLGGSRKHEERKMSPERSWVLGAERTGYDCFRSVTEPEKKERKLCASEKMDATINLAPKSSSPVLANYWSSEGTPTGAVEPNWAPPRCTEKKKKLLLFGETPRGILARQEANASEWVRERFLRDRMINDFWFEHTRKRLGAPRTKKNPQFPVAWLKKRQKNLSERTSNTFTPFLPFNSENCN